MAVDSRRNETEFDDSGNENDLLRKLEELIKERIAIVMQLRKTHVGDATIKSLLKLPSEEEMAKLWGVSRNSVRAAIRVLNALKVIESHRRSGNIIAETGEGCLDYPFNWLVILDMQHRKPTDNAGLKELAQARAVIELGCVPLAIANFTKADVAHLRQLLTSLAFNPSDPEHDWNQPGVQQEAFRANQEFHLHLVKTTNNFALYRVLQSLLETRRLYQQTLTFIPDGNKIKTNYKRHRDMTDCIARIVNIKVAKNKRDRVFVKIKNRIIKRETDKLIRLLGQDLDAGVESISGALTRAIINSAA